MPRKMKPKPKSAPQAQKVLRTVKGAQRVWKENVELFLEVCGAFRLTEDAVYEWCLHTSAGDLEITVHDTFIHSRFDDIPAGRVATKALGNECNPDGKWNFDYDEDAISSQSALICWARLIEDLLDYKPDEEQVREIALWRKNYYWQPGSLPRQREAKTDEGAEP